MDNKGLFKLLKLDNLIEHLTGYLEDRIALVKIELKEELALVVTKTIISIIMVIFFLFALLFTSITVAFYINSFFSGHLTGFFIVSLFYFVLFIIALVIIKHPKLNSWVEKKVNQISGSKT